MNEQHHSNTRNTFPKSERLKKRSDIKTLFQNGKAFSFDQFRVVYQFIKPSTDIKLANVKVGVSIPKKYFKKATTRNLLRRRIKEQYRIHKQEILAALPPDLSLHIFIIYQSKEVITSATIKEIWNSVMRILIQKIPRQ